MQVKWTRRGLLRHGSLALTALVLGCKVGVNGDSADSADSAVPSESEGIRLSKEVYVQVLGPDRVRLRFETLEDAELLLVITDPAGVEVEIQPERSAATLSYDWNYIADNDFVEGQGDVAGEHVLHTVMLTELIPGSRYHWVVDRGEGASTSGSFRAPPGPGEAFRIGWLADTMTVYTNTPIDGLAAKEPDVVIHGGDLVYQSHIYDTWVEFSRAMAPLTQQAAFMPCVGNHEFESMNEEVEMFDRLYSGQGDSHGARYFAFTYGCLRFIGIDSESSRQGDSVAVAEQNTWLESELAAAAADPEISVIAVGMHRPMYTLSRYWVSNAADRDIRHQLFVQYGVSLVFAGHMHGHERFEVDGITYVVDGGGGAFLYDPVEFAEAVESMRPGESALQKSWSRSHGFSLLDVASDGSWTLSRFDSDQDLQVDSFAGPPVEE
jgi:acid phosphatase type 7